MSQEQIQLSNGQENPFNPPPGGTSGAMSAALASSPRRLDLLRGNVMLAALFAGGLVVVYVLSLRGGPAKASAEQAQTQLQVDTAMLQLHDVGGEAQRLKSREIVASFSLDAQQRQIPLKAVQGNPFAFRTPLGIALPVNASAGEPEPTPQNISRDAALAAVQRLRLQSVLRGAGGKSMAMINNNLLAEGQTIDGWMVRRISPRQVELSWGEEARSLFLED